MRKRLFHWLEKQLSAQQRHFPVIHRGDYQTHPDISLESFGEPETISYTVPHHFDGLLPEYVSTIGEVSYPAPFVLDIQKGRIFGRHALVTTADNLIIAESVFNHLPYIEALSSGRVHYPQSVSELFKQISYQAQYDSVFVLANYFENAFYHWMTESLPRLWLWQQYGQTVPILLSRPLPAFAKESLEIFGVKDIVLWDATRAKANNLLMPMAINGTGISSPTILQAVSQHLISGIGTKVKMDSPRIYISRKNSAKRRVINEDAVVRFVEKHGFEVFTLETLSFAEQIALFEQAEVVIGAHGAGFANCIHSRNIKMLEFFEPDYINLCFYRLSCGYGFDYGYLVGQSDGANILLDVSKLESMMCEMEII